MKRFCIKIKKDEIFKALGYRYREKEKDWIREDNLNGRFHAKKIRNHKNQPTTEFHYDFFGPASGKHITSIPLPYTLRAEESRIQRYLSSQNKVSASRTKRAVEPVLLPPLQGGAGVQTTTHLEANTGCE